MLIAQIRFALRGLLLNNSWHITTGLSKQKWQFRMASRLVTSEAIKFWLCYRLANRILEATMVTRKKYQLTLSVQRYA